MLRFSMKSERFFAIAATAVLSGGLAAHAFSPHRQDEASRRTHPTWRRILCSNNELLSIFTPTRLQCEARDQKSTPWPMIVSPEYHLELVPIPDRAKESSHVIFGLLLGKDLVEQYDVYKVVGHGSDELILARVALGKNLDGHTGVIHGGILALLLDDLMGFAFHVMGIPTAFTANLTIDYRTPVMANTHVVVRVKCERHEGRKLYFVAQVMSPDQTILYVEARSLYIIPKVQESVVRTLARFVGC